MKQKKLIIMCAWCEKKMKIRGTWAGVDRKLLHCDKTAISHGLCPQCATSMRDSYQMNDSNSFEAVPKLSSV